MEVPQSAREHTLRPGRGRLLVVVSLLACLILALAIVWQRWSHSPAPPLGAGSAVHAAPVDDPRLTYRTPYRNVRPDVKYVGDTACNRCHRPIADSYHRHPMGRSAAPIAQWTPLENPVGAKIGSFEALGLQYTVERRGQRVFHRESCRSPQGAVIAEREAEVRCVVGSGTHGYSFLVGDNGYLFQSPIGWYAGKKIWDLSPRYAEHNLHFGRPIPVNCLFCHCNPVEPVPGADNRYRQPLFPAGSAIGCERCHGPGQLHVQRRQRQEEIEGDIDDTIVNPARLDPSLREAVCQQCHLQGKTAVLRRGRQWFDYRPGLPLHLFRTVFVGPPQDAPDLRVAGQVEQMHASRCFRGSDGKLECLSCHDPHAKPADEAKMAYFRQRCLHCHQENSSCSLAQRERRKQNQDDCAACHMPRLDTDAAHVAATDHRILRRPQPAAAPPKIQPLLPGQFTLVLFHQNLLEPGDPETSRDLGVALMRQVVGQYARDPQSWSLVRTALPLLESALERAPDDVEAWEAKGHALQLQGRHAEALAAYEKVIAAAPGREMALEQAAKVAERLGQNTRAIESWQRAIASGPGRWQYHYHVARLREKAGEWAKALAACQEALRLNPFDVDVRTVQVRCLLASGNKNQARAAFDALLALKPSQAEELSRWFREQKR